MRTISRGPRKRPSMVPDHRLSPSIPNAPMWSNGRLPKREIHYEVEDAWGKPSGINAETNR
jgi:hypothetical protein